MKKTAIFMVAACCCLAAITGCKNQTDTDAAAVETTVEEDIPAVINYQLLKEYPHDPGAYTQGLIWQGKQLLEGTGQYGESNIRKVDLATGRVLQQLPNDSAIFGEGITLLQNKLYQITWQNKVAYVYDAQTFKKLGEFTLNTEGWGLTNNGTDLILSDGSSNLYFLNPQTFQELRRVGVYDNMGPRAAINELEYINGYVYANIYQTDFIVKIDPSSGKIVGRADLSDLRSKAGIPPITGAEGSPEVLNGIAYDSANNRIFITGKYWPKLFEIKLDN
jgi:glutamine cyclotransferase